MLLYSGEARLARVLMALADPDVRDPSRYALPQVTQEFIARMVGTTRSRVNHFLGKFKKRRRVATGRPFARRWRISMTPLAWA